MILVDTSVWIAHLRHGHAALRRQLEEGLVYSHAMVVGELACGNLRNRETIVQLLQRLPKASEVTHDEALAFLESRRLMGIGLGWIDVHLLAAAVVERCTLWTLDRALIAAATSLGVAHQSS